MLDPFQLEFVQRGVLEVLLLSGAAGLLGTWIVMRGLSFYAHAVGTAAFPGLVLADGLGFSAPLGAFAAALVFAFGVERLARRPRAGYDSLTALVLVAALAGGVVLASDVFHSGGNVDSLLFGSLLLTGTRDLVLAGAASAAAIAATLALGPRWLARGFDPAAARAMGLRSQWPDALLLVLIAFAVVASLTAIGALLATALFVVPAATVRLWTQRLPVWQLGVGGARRRPGHRRPVALGRAEHAARADRRGARRRALRGVAGLAPARRRPARPRCAGRRRRCCSRSSSPPAAGARRRSSSGPDVVATTTQIGDWARAVGGDAVDVHQILQPNTDPHEYEPRPADVEAVAGRQARVRERRRARCLDGDRDLERRRLAATSSISARRCRCACAGESEGDEASRYDPHWWHDPRNAEAAVGAIRDCARRCRSCGRGDLPRATRPPTCKRLRALDAGIAACLAQRACSAAQARLRPRRVQLLRAPLRDRRSSAR